jgi:hypothetical protein
LGAASRDRVDLGAYVLRGIGSAAALYGLLAVDVAAWWVSITGAGLGSAFLVSFWYLTRAKHGSVGEAGDRQDEQDRDGDAEEISHVSTYCGSGAPTESHRRRKSGEAWSTD